MFRGRHLGLVAWAARGDGNETVFTPDAKTRCCANLKSAEEVKPRVAHGPSLACTSHVGHDLLQTSQMNIKLHFQHFGGSHFLRLTLRYMRNRLSTLGTHIGQTLEA